MKGLFENWKTIPNLLSFIRILLIPVFAVLFYNDQLIAAVGVLALSGLSDFFDGKIARKYNQISDLGKILDPVADKLTQITIAVMLFIRFYGCDNEMMKTFSWVFLFFLAKEALMILIGGIMLLLGLRPSAAEIYGKLATMAFYVVMIIIIAFGPEVGAFREWFVLPETVLMVLVVIAAVMTFIALLSYFPDTFRQFKEKNKDKK